MKKVLLALAIVATLTTGCDDDKLTNGTVYDKNFTPAHDVTTYICAARDKNGICTLQVPSTQHYPNKWEICIEGTKNNKGRAPHNCFDVQENEYNEYRKGDHYPH